MRAPPRGCTATKARPRGRSRASRNPRNPYFMRFPAESKKSLPGVFWDGAHSAGRGFWRFASASSVCVGVSVSLSFHLRARCMLPAIGRYRCHHPVAATIPEPVCVVRKTPVRAGADSDPSFAAAGHAVSTHSHILLAGLSGSWQRPQRCSAARWWHCLRWTAATRGQF